MRRQIKLNVKLNERKYFIYPMVRQTFPINQCKTQSNTDKSYHFDEPVQYQYCLKKKKREKEQLVFALNLVRVQ